MSLMMNTFYSCRVLQWATCLHQPIETQAKSNMKSNFMIILDWITILTSGNTSGKTRKKILDNCEIILNKYLIKPDDLLILKSRNNDIQFTMELNDNKLPFLYILITKSGKKKLDEHLFKINLFKPLCFLPL